MSQAFTLSPRLPKTKGHQGAHSIGEVNSFVSRQMISPKSSHQKPKGGNNKHGFGQTAHSKITTTNAGSSLDETDGAIGSTFGETTQFVDGSPKMRKTNNADHMENRTFYGRSIVDNRDLAPISQDSNFSVGRYTVIDPRQRAGN